MALVSVPMESTDSKINQLNLPLNHHSKTIDTGRNGYAISCGPSGDILQISCYHPVHGVVVVSPFEQFDGNHFHCPDYVRAYRTKLLDYVRGGILGYGLRINGTATDLNIAFLEDQWIMITYAIGEAKILTKLWIGENGEVIQSVSVASDSPSLELSYDLSIGLSVNRASYGQLTEGGPIPIPECRNETKISSSGYGWAVVNKNLNAMIEGALFQNGRPVSIGGAIGEDVVVGSPARGIFHGRLRLTPGQPCTLTASFCLRPGTTPSLNSLRLSAYPSSSGEEWKLNESVLSLIIRRNFGYILHSCTFPIGDDAICFITDHVALPLGWNRDNYWQIRFFLDVNQNLDDLVHLKSLEGYSNKIRYYVKGHLTWVFNKAKRPHGYWHRSYLANGAPKDGPVFQLDQQCYPLLELCDFFQQFPAELTFVQKILKGDTISSVLRMLENHRDSVTGLYRTDETPADDMVEYPFHFSSHILLWYTITRLSMLYSCFPEMEEISISRLEHIGSRIKTATLRHFISKQPQTGNMVFAYLTDGHGKHTFYHDANDVPTLFAPDWNFIDTPELEVIWNQTMMFGLSPVNEGGFYPDGKFGGLGSIHTRGPWPLGYAQEFIYGNLSGNVKLRDDAWRKIQGSMFWDGLFPEAVDCDTGDCVSKAWFSWPGSMIASALLRFSLKPAKKALI
ncbi:Six-hairpin glycosidase-like protein [Xylogone sp. PMI_703]|nr:Six-hairpin glycosidase-like protein [Xylogone sp. PMI_703]